MNVRYTFYCERGMMLHSGKHYLLLGSWIVPDPARFVVLVHGQLSRKEYYRLCTRYNIGIYSVPSVNWTDIKPYQEGTTWVQYPVGWLVKIRNNEYRGRLVCNGMI